ncbi:hypothetical protein HRI_005229600 [Hibiscus trionum]|uniref:Uncharacterized protein n=1 Tax=Hibiscus trionum TaxID=183268 RepID=A0A9W7JL04_HIBTR|nr:hypothetical protein HRI_005229600 [Hibiscus trionum]
MAVKNPVFESPAVSAVARHPVKMSHTVGTTQVEEDISKNEEKIADSVTTVKSEETVEKDKEKEADSAMTEKFEEMEDLQPLPDLPTNIGSKLPEPEPERSEDEQAVKTYNVRFRPGINFEQQSLLLMDKVTCKEHGWLPNIEDRCIMEVMTTKEVADRIKGLDEVVSVEPFLGVHNFGGFSIDPFIYV